MFTTSTSSDYNERQLQSDINRMLSTVHEIAAVLDNIQTTMSATSTVLLRQRVSQLMQSRLLKYHPEIRADSTNAANDVSP